MTTHPPSAHLMRRSARAFCVALAVLVSAGAAHAEVMSFDPGSLIIPMQANYQSACGTTSAYGLVWRLLQSNEAGHYNAAHPVTLYLAVATKSSINRCSPSNVHDSAEPTTVPNRSGASWLDGCDVTVLNGATQPVTMAPLNTALPTGNIYPTTSVWNVSTTGRTISNNGNTWPYAAPAYPVETLSTASGFRTARYLGGPILIAAADVPNIVGFLRNGDAYVSASELSKFITPTTSCDSANVPSTSYHYVRVHQALVGFSADINRKLNSVPPRIALVNLGTNVSTGILDKYLKNAGLDEPANCATTHSCYGGCPQGSLSTCSVNGSTSGTTNKYPGLIYDNLDGNLDIHSTSADTYGLLNRTDAKNRLIYKVLWAPHWEVTATAGTGVSKYVSNGDGASTEDQNVRNNIGHFTDQPNTGLMSECASVGSFEGGSNTTPTNPGTSNARFLSTAGWTINKLSAGNYGGKNCTDPDYTSGSCMLYPAPSDPFSQVGDFTYFMVTGVVQDYVPYLPTSSYAVGEQRLAASFPNYNPSTNGSVATATATTPTGDLNRTAFSWGQKGNNAKKATVLYLGGHDYSGVSVPGNRVVLNTLLNLGYDPVSAERSLTQPVGFVDPNGSDTDGSRVTVLGTTYDAVTGYPTSPAVRQFTSGQQSQWVFPYYPGNLRDHSLVGGSVLTNGSNALSDGTLWSADDELPLPGARNIFTYVGGSETSPAKYTSYDNAGSVNGATGPTTNGVAQTGWTPISVNYSSIGTGCVDKMKLATDAGTVALVPGTDGICDLQEMLQRTTPATTGSGSTLAINLPGTVAAMNTDKVVTQQLVQKIRGYCIASSTQDDTGTPILQPSDLQCNNEADANRAQLGGFITSSPTIIPASPYLLNDQRPTVAYAGGWDGQLHAFYVSGGETYTGPATSLHFPGVSAASTFVTALPNASGISPGQEIWSFIPASQLAWLASNNARVDSTPVFGEFQVDMTGSGNKEWHTFLAASIGSTMGREFFVFDVTNPLRPILLWDLTGSLFQTGGFPFFSNSVLTNSTTLSDNQSYKWFEQANTRFWFPLLYGVDPGLAHSGNFNENDLGASVGMDVGQLNSGPPILVVTSNSYGADTSGTAVNGVEVFAINLNNGQKLWQWQRGYASSFAYNNAPPRATLTGSDNAGDIDTIWVADLEGRLWELDATTGRNKNTITSGVAGCTVLTPCPIPAYDLQSTTAHPQPISTNLAVGKLPTANISGLLAPLAGDTFIMFGTTGYDWVPTGTSGEPGNMHMLIIDSTARAAAGNININTGATWTATTASAYNQSRGVLVEPTSTFPMRMNNGEHVYGYITLAGTDAYFSTSNAPIGNDPMAISATTTGASYVIHMASLTSSTPPPLSSTLANFGGVTVVHNVTGTTSTDYVVGQQISKISNTVISNGVSIGSSSPNPSLNPSGGTIPGKGPGAVLNFIRRLWSAP